MLDVIFMFVTAKVRVCVFCCLNAYLLVKLPASQIQSKQNRCWEEIVFPDLPALHKAGQNQHLCVCVYELLDYLLVFLLKLMTKYVSVSGTLGPITGCGHSRM